MNPANDDAAARLASVRAQRERGDLKQILSRYGNIDVERGEPWDDVELVLEIARAYSLVGNDAKVETYFLRCAQLHPRRAALYRCQIGWFFQRKKRWARALTWYDRALETFPSYHLCLFRKGYCLERLHRPRGAVAALELACGAWDKAPPDQRERSRGIHVQILFHLARNLREIGATDRAREALDRCAALDDRLTEKVIKPEHRLASYGETYLHDGDAAAALTHLEAAREIDPHSAVIWERLGRAYAMAGRDEDAERALIRATELPKGAVAQISLGRFYLAGGRTLDAARAFTSALRQHPQGEVQIRMELADLQVALGRPQAALHELERLAAGRVPPQSTLAVAVETRIATILLEHGLAARALPHLQAAVGHDPENPEIRARLERLQRELDTGGAPGPVRPFENRPLPAEIATVLGDHQQPRIIGRVANYFPERGFGFIVHGDDDTLFFHVTQCEPSPPESLAPGTTVTFVVGVNHRSRKPQAEHVRVVEEASLLPGDAPPHFPRPVVPAWRAARPGGF